MAPCTWENKPKSNVATSKIGRQGTNCIMLPTYYDLHDFIMWVPNEGGLPSHSKEIMIGLCPRQICYLDTFISLHLLLVGYVAQNACNIQIVPIVICLTIFKIQLNVLFITKVKIHTLFRSPPPHHVDYHASNGQHALSMQSNLF